MNEQSISIEQSALQFIANLRNEPIRERRLELIAAFFASGRPYNAIVSRKGMGVAIATQMHVAARSVQYLDDYFKMAAYEAGESGVVPPRLERDYAAFVQGMGLPALHILESDAQWMTDTPNLRREKLLTLNSVLARWPLIWQTSILNGSDRPTSKTDLCALLLKYDEVELSAYLPIVVILNASDSEQRRMALAVGEAELRLNVERCTGRNYLAKSSAVYLHQATARLKLPDFYSRDENVTVETFSLAMSRCLTFDEPTRLDARVGIGGSLQFFH